MNPTIKPYIEPILKYSIVCIRWGVGLLFVFSGLSKLLDIQTFLKTLYSFGIVSPHFVPLISYIIPFVELLLGTALILNIRVQQTSNRLTGILVLFTTIIFEKLSVLLISHKQSKEITCLKHLFYLVVIEICVTIHM